MSQRHSNTTIGSLLSQFCSGLFPNFDFHIGDTISFIPHENEKMDFPPLGSTISQYENGENSNRDVPGVFMRFRDALAFVLCGH